MTIDQLIKNLEAALKAHGNIEAYIGCGSKDYPVNRVVVELDFEDGARKEGALIIRAEELI